VIFGIGPKEKWHSDLEKLSRAALVEIVLRMQFRLLLLGGSFAAEEMAELIEHCKKMGRWANEAAAFQRYLADPKKAIDQTIRRMKAAKAAARRRKRERRA
jgi:hypothetical protein